MTITIKPTKPELTAKSKRRRDQFDQRARVQRTAPVPRNDLTPTLAVVQRPIDSLKIPERNVRVEDPVQDERIASSMAAFGVVQPILIQADGTIVNGAAVWRAARKLGLTEVPCIVVSHLSAAELKHLRITLNRTGELGGWSLPDLKLEFEDLAVGELALEITGFTLPEIDGCPPSAPVRQIQGSS